MVSYTNLNNNKICQLPFLSIHSANCKCGCNKTDKADEFMCMPDPQGCIGSTSCGMNTTNSTHCAPQGT